MSAALLDQAAGLLREASQGLPSEMAHALQRIADAAGFIARSMEPEADGPTGNVALGAAGSTLLDAGWAFIDDATLRDTLEVWAEEGMPAGVTLVVAKPARAGANDD